ncbi:KamA family radical SAM protein [Litoreibacter roseus]|uniref:Radical SAM core domain-containing protein n=1 Tax=Litoreibacter roseus TaxID=2601869 RepID=A0A6N6JLV5_9RHOB|nr:radical SAM protein [Litoreibacter roseus]GFE67291.1 hypothetical protein KIN_43650 [Litoreibacter roseus]
MNQNKEIEPSLDKVDPISEVRRKYPVLLPGTLKRRIEQGTYSERAARQYQPQAQELLNSNQLSADPCNEGDYRVTENLIKKYHNRAALIVTHRCIAYCRFCFRKDFVGQSSQAINPAGLEHSISEIEKDVTISDVLVSGGDPLAIPNKELLPILSRLSQVDHIKSIRIHTRGASLTPHRINDRLLEYLSTDRKIWFYTHMNHIDDLRDPDVEDALYRISRTGTPLLNQAVLLGGVNDTVADIHDLLLGCYERRIVPYHLYSFDPVQGAGHFSVDPDVSLEIFTSLAGLPGPAQPVFVVVDEKNSKRRFVFDPSSGTDTLKDLLMSRHPNA